MTAGLPATLLWAFAGLGAAQSYSSNRPSLDAGDLELIRFVSWSRTYASQQFECKGVRPGAARKQADAALGADYIARLQRVSVKLSRKYGEDAVEQAGYHVTPGYGRSAQACRRFENLVPDALERLRELERRTKDPQ